jgi:hypothetical protein
MQYMGSRADRQSQRGPGRWLGGRDCRLAPGGTLAPCTHLYKYRLYFGADGHCRVRYDNERGKGDHRHVNGVEQVYSFASLSALLDDFQRDVENWR